MFILKYEYASQQKTAGFARLAMDVGTFKVPWIERRNCTNLSANKDLGMADFTRKLSSNHHVAGPTPII